MANTKPLKPYAEILKYIATVASLFHDHTDQKDVAVPSHIQDTIAYLSPYIDSTNTPVSEMLNCQSYSLNSMNGWVTRSEREVEEDRVECGIVDAMCHELAALIMQELETGVEDSATKDQWLEFARKLCTRCAPRGHGQAYEM